MKSPSGMDTQKALVCFPDGRVTQYTDQKLAYAVWLALPTGTRVAFRGENDTRPVYPWDYADTLATEGPCKRGKRLPIPPKGIPLSRQKGSSE